VALYADRAASALHGFALTGENVDAVTELCRRLEGMPLAIELAAGHARVMSPAQVLERMGERLDLPASRSGAVPIRQQSLQAAVQWSYDLCSQAEQVLWARLSVFAGSFDLAAAEAVCTGTGSADVAETVSALVDKSVLISEPHATGMRYRLLETIRQYGSHKLRESQDRQNGASEELLRSRHLGWYSGQAAQFDRSWFGPGQRSWVERLRVELPNIRAALSFAVKHSAHADRGLRLAGDLCIFWRMGALREGEQWLTRLLQADAEPTVGRARAQVALAWLLAARGQPQAISVADEALSTAERVEPSLVPRAMCIRSSAMAGQDLEGTMKVLHTALAEAKRIGSGSDMALAMHDLGWSLGVAGRVAEADSYFDDSLALTEEAGELWLRGAMQFRRALVGWMHGDLERMTLAATDALRAARVVNDPFTCANAASLIGVAAVGSNDRLAATLFGAAERFWEDAGGSIVTTPPWQGLLDDAKARCLGGTGAAGFDEQYRRGRQHPLEDAITAALDEPPQRPSIPLAQHDFGLTRRELEVVELVSQGLTNKEIATRLVISSRTAETHVQNALTKTGFNSRSQLAAWRAAQVQGRRESGPRTAGQ
jgi:non-specific serine/threonine protein kinase